MPYVMKEHAMTDVDCVEIARCTNFFGNDENGKISVILTFNAQGWKIIDQQERSVHTQLGWCEFDSENQKIIVGSALGPDKLDMVQVRNLISSVIEAGINLHRICCKYMELQQKISNRVIADANVFCGEQATVHQFVPHRDTFDDDHRPSM